MLSQPGGHKFPQEMSGAENSAPERAMEAHGQKMG